MGDASLGALLLRTLFALVLVLAIIAIAYTYLKRRNAGGSSLSRRRTSSRRSQNGIEIVGRVGLTRANAAVAIKFGERVLLVAAPEQGTSSVLAEMPAEEWADLTEVREQIPPHLLDGSPGDNPRPNFVEALRQATSRNG